MVELSDGNGRRGTALLQRIVVGYAGDQAGRDAVRLAAVLAAEMGGEVTVVFPYHPLLASESGEAAEARVRQEVAALTEDVGGLPARACHWTPSSWPIHGLHELAAYEQAQLIVFGSAREGLAEHVHVSLMERMVHGAPCAVAVAPDGYAEAAPGPLRNVGVGLSTSQEGMHALRLGRELALRSSGELHVIAAAGLEPALAAYGFASPALPEVERQIFQQTKDTLELACAELGGGVEVHAEAVRGEPVRVLVERSAGLDILLLGSRAYGPVRHVLMGSVSAPVMRRARCPVLVVPRGVLALPSAVREGEGDPQDLAVD